MKKQEPRPLTTWEPKIGNGIYSFISGIDFIKDDVVIPLQVLSYQECLELMNKSEWSKPFE